MRPSELVFGIGHRARRRVGHEDHAFRNLRAQGCGQWPPVVVEHGGHLGLGMLESVPSGVFASANLSG